MPDRLLRGLFPEHNFRFAVAQTSELCSEAIQRLQCDWLAGWLLSEALTCGVLLSVGLKDQERHTVRWDYSGPAGQILVELGENGEVRGYPQKRRLLADAATLTEALGKTGRVSVSSSFPRRLGRRGITETVFQNISRDLGHFLSLSFQTESALATGLIMPLEGETRVGQALGLLLQPMPGADMMAFDALRQRMDSDGFSQWLESAPRQLGTVLEHLELGEPPEILSETTPRFVCNCTRKKVESMLRMLEPQELREMCEQDGGTHVDCHFCAEQYQFSSEDLESLLEQSQPGHG